MASRSRRRRDARDRDGRRINTVKNVFEGPFFELDVALTMGVMKHRRKPGISSNEGQKWWRQLISKPLMWDLRDARGASTARGGGRRGDGISRKRERCVDGARRVDGAATPLR